MAAGQARGRAVKRFASFAESVLPVRASNRTSRRLHFVGGVLVLLGVAVATADARWVIAALACGYGFAWIGHFVFEKNRPATFRHPLYSFLGEWVMFKDILSGKIRF